MDRYPINEAPKNLIELTKNYSDVFGSLTSDIVIEVYEPKETIISFSKEINKLRFMIQGRGKITLIHEDGKQSIVHFVKANEYLGELTFLDIEKEHKNVSAITQCVFISVDMKLAKKKLTKDKEFLYSLSQFVGRKMLNRTYFNSKNQNYELKNRLAAYILISQNQGIYAEKHTETAEYLSVSYRHLLFTLKEFVEEGMIIKVKNGYKIDVVKLSDLSKDIVL